MFRFVKIAVLLGVVALATESYAHHSFQATFTSDAKIEVEGVVTKFSFKNPHILVYLDVTNEDGSVTPWVSEGAAATLMRRAGWSRDTVKPGDVIRVYGDSTHDGSPMVSIDRIDVLDPQTMAAVRTLGRNAERGGNTPTPKAAPMALTLDDGRPNLSGAWTNHGMAGGRPTPPSLEFSEAGKALQATWDKANDPQIFCDPPGLVRQLNTPHPVRITQLDDRVILEYEEYAGRREVLLGSETPPAGDKSHFGNSVAYYEDDALVIETVNLLGNPGSPEGHLLGDQATTVERYTRADSDRYGPTLRIHVTISDPVNLVKDGEIKRDKMSAGEYEFIENDCRPPLRDRS